MALHGDRSIGGCGSSRVLGFGLERHAKRVFDFVVATMGVILFSPILLVASIAIKLDSRGPVFLREIRYGYENRAIRVLKFRSMSVCAEANEIHSRPTRIGRVLSLTGIDELPQLFNVLRGEMSIVGPRPYARRQDSFEYGLMPWLSGFKPGMTGLAQINEAREGFGSTAQRVNDDLHYVEDWSLFLDVKIILTMLFL